MSQIQDNSPLRENSQVVFKGDLRSFTPTAEMLAESEANLKAGGDVM